jgi:hypothetical protein
MKAEEKPDLWSTMAGVLEFLIAPATLLTALAYLAGWLYKLNYLAMFGIPHESLVLSIQYYITASWTSFFLGIAMLLAGITLSILMLTWRAGTPKASKFQDFLRNIFTIGVALIPVFLVVFFVFLSPLWFEPWFPPVGGNAVARFLQSMDVNLGLTLIGIALLGITLLWRARRNAAKPKPEEVIAEFRAKPSVALLLTSVMLIFAYIAVFLLIAGWLGQYHAKGSIRGSKIPLPEVVLYTSVDRPLPIPDGRLVELSVSGQITGTKPVATYQYTDLHLVLVNDGRYYVFRRSEVQQERPRVYVITRDNLLYIELKPSSIWVPIY